MEAEPLESLQSTVIYLSIFACSNITSQMTFRFATVFLSAVISHELAPSIEGAFSDMLEIIDSGTPLAKCYFADNDLIAIGAIKALKLRGYKIPDDIAIIGFDNISEGRILDPSLTTIDIPRRFMGQTAVDQLIRQMEDPASHTVKLQISTSLIKRFSV